MLEMGEATITRARTNKQQTPLSGRAHHYTTRELSGGYALTDGRGEELGTFATVRLARLFALERFLPESGRGSGGYRFN